MSIISKLKKGSKDPKAAFTYLMQSTKNKFVTREYIAQSNNRSGSENGLYLKAVQNATKDYKSFSNFKRSLNYREILEHVSKDQGQVYLDNIIQNSPDLLGNINIFKENDAVGNPIVYEYKGIGLISPTSLRYLKVASDLKIIFGEQIGDKIVEIGCGYGGQALINDRVFKIKQYKLIDLPPVLTLISKYLESYILNCAYETSTLNQISTADKYDLAISNYAFSELPGPLQRMYIEKILKNCKKGYLTMNSGKSDTKTDHLGRMTIKQLEKLLPPFEILEEKPLTNNENYIIVWGRNY